MCVRRTHTCRAARWGESRRNNGPVVVCIYKFVCMSIVHRLSSLKTVWCACMPVPRRLKVMPTKAKPCHAPSCLLSPRRRMCVPAGDFKNTHTHNTNTHRNAGLPCALLAYLPPSPLPSRRKTDDIFNIAGELRVAIISQLLVTGEIE